MIFNALFFSTEVMVLIQVLELSHWSQLKLDFVIGGLDSCGTNTLTHGLGQADCVFWFREGQKISRNYDQFF